ncbi:unnamed protein product [Calicophoron daubneyi]|uniref:CUE domain-containing protein n=1 Tax=Calicophoron daubneyi TaxID=300641 RepID=A0AAV2TKT9_CALDB
MTSHVQGFRTVQNKFIAFVPLPSNPSKKEINDFVRRLRIICADLGEVLALNYADFWYQVVFNESLRCCLESFLQQSPKANDVSLLPSCAAADFRQMILLMLSLLVRVTDCKEGEANGVSLPKFGTILYSNVLDLTRFMDACSIYSGVADSALKSIAENMFRCEARYLRDLRKLMDSSCKVLERMESELTVPDRLSSYDQLLSIAENLKNTTSSFYAFLDIISQLSSNGPSYVCFSSHLPEKLASLFDHCCVPLQNAIQNNLDLSSKERGTLSSMLCDATALIVLTVRKTLIEPCLLNQLVSKDQKESAAGSICSGSSEPLAAELVDQYIRLSLSFLSYPKFSLALQLTYPLEKDLALLKQTAGWSNVDDGTVQYLLNANRSLPSEAGIPNEYRNFVFTNQSGVAVGKKEEQLIAGPSMSRSVREVKEVLPDLSVESIQRYLDMYNGDSGHVIDAVLENRIKDGVLDGVGSCESNNKPVIGAQEQKAQPSSSRPATSDPVSEVKEVLPDLDVDSIKRYLKHYDGDVAQLVNAALEGKLPQNIGKRNKESKNLSRDSGFDLATAAATGMIDVGSNQLWQGKKDEAAISLSKVGGREKRITKRLATSVWEDEDEDREVDGLAANLNHLDPYEDEYDDTFDVHEGAVGAVESEEEAAASDSESENTTKNPTASTADYDPQAQYGAAKGDYRSGNYSKYDGSRGDQVQSRPYQAPVLRIENPETVRERQAQQYQKRAYRRGRMHNAYVPPLDVPPQPVRFDEERSHPSNNTAYRRPFSSGYSSGQRGRYQNTSYDDRGSLNAYPASEESTGRSDQQCNRSEQHYRGVHKSRYGNHNRRWLADRKRQF